MDRTRREEAKRLEERNDATLKGTRYLWLHDTLPEKHQSTSAELLDIYT